MRRFKPALLAIAVALALAGCSLKTFSPDDATQAVAAKAYADLVTGQDAALMAEIPSNLDPVQQHQVIAALRAMAPDGPAQPGVLVGWNTSVSPGEERSSLTYRFDYAKAAVLFTTSLERTRKTDPWKMAAINVQPAKLGGKTLSFGTLPNPPPTKTAPAGS